MRCPNCGFVSFDDLEQCKKCGFDIDAHRKGAAAPRSSWFSRRRPATIKTQSPVRRGHESTMREQLEAERQTAEREREKSRELRAEMEAKLREAEQARLKAQAELKSALDDQHGIESELTAARGTHEQLARELEESRRQAASKARAAEEIRAKAEALAAQQAEVKRLEDERRLLTEAARSLQEEREQLEAERQTAEREREKSRELRAEMEAKLREAEQARLKAQAELKSALDDQHGIESELTAARGTHEQLARELEESRRQAASKARAAEEIRAKAEALAAQQAEVKRLEDERRLLTEAARSLQEERERLEHERLRRGNNRHLETRQPAAIPENEPPTVGKPAPLTKPAWLDDAPAPPARPARVAARAEDLLELYSRPRGQQEQEWRPHEAEQSPPAPRSAQPPLADDDGDFEEILYEIEEEKETRSKAPPKGGLLFRSLAAAIDLALLVAVVAVFLVIGFFVSGASGGGVLPLLGMLGLPFYIVFLLLAAAYFTYMHGVYGQTLGKRVLGLRVMTTHGEDLGYLNAFFRFVATCFAVGFMGMGVFWMALDPNKQGWHDKLSRTVVVRL